ncbi:ABC transporter substrate-binding protein [Actinophytocola sediminis]
MNRTVIEAWLADLTFPNYMDALHELGRQFEQAHPEYEIRIRGLYFEDLADAVDRAARTGQRPAIAEYYYTWTPNALDAVDQAGRPLFTSVERAVAGRKDILGEPVVLEDVIPLLRAQYTVRGDFVSLPTVATSFHLFTNVDMLHAAGLTKVPESWQELRAACEQAVSTPDGPRYAINWANNGISFQHALAVQGAHLVDNGNGRLGRATKVDFTTPQMLAWVSWWRDLYTDGLYHYTGETADWYGTFEEFANQRVPFRLSSSNDIGASADAAKEHGFELAVTRFPYNDEVPYQGNVAAGTSLWLADGLDQVTQDGALAFMQFLNNPRNAARYHQLHSFIPVTQAAVDLLDREGWFDEHPYHRAPNDQFALMDRDRTSTVALVGDYFRIQEVLCAAMHDIMVHAVDPVERLIQATAEAQYRLDQYLAEHPGPRGDDQALAS